MCPLLFTSSQVLQSVQDLCRYVCFSVCFTACLMWVILVCRAAGVFRVGCGVDAGWVVVLIADGCRGIQGGGVRWGL